MFLVCFLSGILICSLFNLGVFLEILSFFFVLMFISMFSFSENIFFFSFLDNTSFILFCLTLWFACVLLLVSVKYRFMFLSFIKMKFSLIILTILLMMTFLMSSFISFYFFFEVSLFPLVFLILGWGYQVERISAFFYLFFYTLFGSFPLFLAIIFLFYSKMSSSWSIMKFIFIFSSFSEALILFFILFISLMVKLPLYLLHLWLPKAHVEASASGSMILAGVLLKLSGYGFIRVLYLYKFIFSFYLFLVLLCFYGAFLSASICARQSDLKSLIAYSSISHMGVMMGGVFFFSFFSLEGAVIIMVAHAFCSSALFFMLNFHYERSLSRQIILLRGLSGFFYGIVVFWVMFLIINFAVPPFLSLFGEIFVMFVSFQMSLLSVFCLGLCGFLVAYYCIFFYSSVMHGVSLKHEVIFSDLGSVYMVLSLHLLPLVLLILKLEIFIY